MTTRLNGTDRNDRKNSSIETALAIGSEGIEASAEESQAIPLQHDHAGEDDDDPSDDPTVQIHGGNCRLDRFDLDTTDEILVTLDPSELEPYGGHSYLIGGAAHYAPSVVSDAESATVSTDVQDAAGAPVPSAVRWQQGVWNRFWRIAAGLATALAEGVFEVGAAFTQVGDDIGEALPESTSGLLALAGGAGFLAGAMVVVGLAWSGVARAEGTSEGEATAVEEDSSPLPDPARRLRWPRGRLFGRKAPAGTDGGQIDKEGILQWAVLQEPHFRWARWGIRAPVAITFFPLDSGASTGDSKLTLGGAELNALVATGPSIDFLVWVSQGNDIFSLLNMSAYLVGLDLSKQLAKQEDGEKRAAFFGTQAIVRAGPAYEFRNKLSRRGRFSIVSQVGIAGIFRGDTESALTRFQWGPEASFAISLTPLSPRRAKPEEEEEERGR